MIITCCWQPSLAVVGHIQRSPLSASPIDWHNCAFVPEITFIGDRFSVYIINLDALFI